MDAGAGSLGHTGTNYRRWFLNLYSFAMMLPKHRNYLGSRPGLSKSERLLLRKGTGFSTVLSVGYGADTPKLLKSNAWTLSRVEHICSFCFCMDVFKTSLTYHIPPHFKDAYDC